MTSCNGLWKFNVYIYIYTSIKSFVGRGGDKSSLTVLLLAISRHDLFAFYKLIHFFLLLLLAFTKIPHTLYGLPYIKNTQYWEWKKFMHNFNFLVQEKKKNKEKEKKKRKYNWEHVSWALPTPPWVDSRLFWTEVRKRSVCSLSWSGILILRKKQVVWNEPFGSNS